MNFYTFTSFLMFPHLIYYLSDEIKLLTLDLQTCLIRISKARVNLTHEQYHAFPSKKAT